MAVTLKVLVQPVQLPATATLQYTTPINTRTIIDKATVTNNDTVTRTFSVNIVPSGGGASNTNLFINSKAVVPGETYLCSELIGQVLTSGDFLSTTASSGSALSLRISGREVT